MAENEKRPIPDLWKDDTLSAREIDPSKFKRTKKTFTVFIDEYKHPTDDIVKDDVYTVAKELFKAGYVYRSTGNKTKINDMLVNMPRSKTEYFLPWKKKMPAESEVVTTGEVKESFEIAMNYFKFYLEKPPVARAVMANEVDLILGKDLSDPIDLMIIYTSTGDETLKKETDYKALGQLSFHIKIAQKSNIPVYNIKNEASVQKIINLAQTGNAITGATPEAAATVEKKTETPVESTPDIVSTENVSTLETEINVPADPTDMVGEITL